MRTLRAVLDSLTKMVLTHSLRLDQEDTQQNNQNSKYLSEKYPDSFICVYCVQYAYHLLLVKYDLVLRYETRIKGARQAEGGQKFCLNMVRKDQLCEIVLLKRGYIFLVLLKMVVMETSHTRLRLSFKALTALMPAVPHV